MPASQAKTMDVISGIEAAEALLQALGAAVGQHRQLAGQRAAEQLFRAAEAYGRAEAVDVGGVEQRDAGSQRRLDLLDLGTDAADARTIDFGPALVAADALLGLRRVRHERPLTISNR